MKTYLCCILIITTFSLHASNVAQAIIVRGNVRVNAPNSNISIIVIKGFLVQERSILTTGPKSFVRLLFKDKSQINIGPMSQMKIEKFSPKRPNVIKLIKGHLRAKISKNYLDEKDTPLKLFVRTKNAGIGVRGTDFQVNYNPKNNYTSLITFEGIVVMAKIEERFFEDELEQRTLEKMLSSKDVVSVKEGQYSGAMPQHKKVTIPIRINPAQFKVLKSNELGIEEVTPKADSVTPKQSYKSVIPPNINAKTLANDSQELEKQMTKAVGKDTVSGILENTKPLDSNDIPPPEGMIDKKTGQIAPTAGGFIDLKTAQYIPPSKDSVFDSSTKTYIPSTGTFDQKTGDFYTSEYKLTDDGRFVSKEGLGLGERKPASSKQTSILPPPLKNNLISINRPTVEKTSETNVNKEDLEDVVKNVNYENEVAVGDYQDIFMQPQTTKLKVHFNVE